MEVSIMKRKMPEKHFAKTGSSCTGGQEDERLHSAHKDNEVGGCTRGEKD
jgi:hypothetical protein